MISLFVTMKFWSSCGKLPFIWSAVVISKMLNKMAEARSRDSESPLLIASNLHSCYHTFIVYSVVSRATNSLAV